MSGSKVEYTWNHANLLTAVVYKTSNNVVTKSVAYQYDGLGRRIGKSVDDNGNGTVDRRESYIYDGAGLLSSFSTGIGGEGARRADEGAAIHISGPNGVMGQHGWVDQMVLSFLDPDGDSSSPSQLASRNLYGDAVDQIFATESGSGDVFWALTDHQGTPRDWVTRSASGTTTIAQHTRYTAFGAVDSVVDASGTPLAASNSLLPSFTGQLADPDTDLLYYRARWYDPHLGKFLSDDPMGFAAGDANVSRMVGNVVSTSTDATGLADWVWPWDPKASWNPVTTATTWHDMTVDLVYTGDVSAPPEVSQAAIDAAANGLPRPNLVFQGTFTTIVPGVLPPQVQVGPTGGVDLVWDWGDLNFDVYTFVGGTASVSLPGPGSSANLPVSAGGSIGIGLVFDLPPDDPTAYEDAFNSVTGTVTPDWIGGYGGVAYPPGPDGISWAEGPWSVDAGVWLGTPGSSLSIARTDYTYNGPSW